MANNELLFKEQHIGSFYMHRVLLSHIYPRVLATAFQDFRQRLIHQGRLWIG